MKKIRIPLQEGRCFSLPKLLIFMKLTTLLLLVNLTCIAATGYSQSEKVTIKVKDATMKDFFNMVEKQTEYKFLYRDDAVENIRVNMDEADMPLDILLDEVFSETEFGYKILANNLIAIAPNELFQQTKVTGTVTNQQGDPLPGVTIIVKGTTTGTLTDAFGKYSISDVTSNTTLIFSFVGMATQEIAINGQTSIDVALKEEAIGLNDVIVVGYGTRKKRDLTGSISTVDTEVLEKVSVASPQFALQGNTTGVRIINTSGDPNAAPRIFVRGIGSWQGTAQPLYVIDGQIITPPQDGNEDVISGPNRDTPPNLWTLVNPNDIESISVLKDASAAAIYGSRGANGVVLITTKKGKLGGPVIEFDVYKGIQNIPTFNMLNTQQYVDLVNEMYTNNLNPDITIENQLYGRTQTDDDVCMISYSPQFDPTSPHYINSRTTYNWQDELTRRNASDESYDLKVSGATPQTDYYLSAGYKNQKGVFLGNALKRYTVAFNLNTDAKKWLRLGVNYKFALENVDMDDYTDLPGLAGVAPWQPLRDPNNKYGFAEVLDTEKSNWHARKVYGQGSRDNYLAFGNLNRRDFNIMRHLGNAFFEIKPVKGLTLRGSINLDYASQDRQEVNTFSRVNIFSASGLDPATVAPAAPTSLGEFGSRVNNILNYQTDFTATYDRNFGKHRLTLTGAVQDQYHVREWRDMQGTYLTNIDDLNRVSYGNDLANNNAGTFKTYKYWFGLVGRANYIYNDKYYLDLSYRRDGSSGFSKEHRWGNFYSVSGAWRISNETFMENLTFINDLKLRGGWGEAGNDETVVGKYAYLSIAGGSGSYGWGSGNGNALGSNYIAVPVSGFPNAGLTWEVVSTSYVGFDAVLLDNKVNMTVEIFNRKTDGIQQYVNLPLSVGTDDPAFNIGVLENKGVDLMLGYNNNIGDFTFGISGNISFLKNEVTHLYNHQPLSTDMGRVEEGRSIGHIWGYKVGGVFQSQSEIDAYYAQLEDKTITNTDYVAPGDLYFQNVGGDPTEAEPFYSTTPDNLINEYDQTEIGNTIPGHTYGINSNAAWKGFDLSVSFYGEGNVDRYNSAKAQLEAMNGETNFLATTLNRWTAQHTSSGMPRAVIGDPAGNNRYSDRFVESAAFFRLNNWQMGYSLPSTLLEGLHDAIKSVRIYIGGQNNLYAFRWSGLDPVNDNKPLPRTMCIGLKAKF